MHAALAVMGLWRIRDTPVRARRPGTAPGRGRALEQ